MVTNFDHTNIVVSIWYLSPHVHTRILIQNHPKVINSHFSKLFGGLRNYSEDNYPWIFYPQRLKCITNLVSEAHNLEWRIK